MNASTVGVVITAYDSAATIKAAITSVLAQTRCPERIIVVDNSPDDAGARIANVTLKGASVSWEVMRIGNAGPGNARNHGWRAARTDWIQFLDADDVLSPAKLAVQLPVAATVAAEVALVHGPWQRIRLIDGEWMPDPAVHFAAGTEDLLVDLLHPTDFIPAAAGLMRTSWLEAVGGFDENLWLLEDIDLYLRLAGADARFSALPHAHPLFFYRVGAQSLSQSSRGDFPRAMVRNAERVERQHEGTTMRPEVTQRLADMYWRAAYGLAEQPDEFVDLIRRVERLAPACYPIAHPVWRAMVRTIGPRATSHAVRAYRRTRRRLGVPDTR